MNSNELNNYINSLNEFGNDELKVKLENFYLFNKPVITFFKGIDSQFKTLLTASNFDETILNNILDSSNKTLQTLTAIKRELLFFDEILLSEKLKTKILNNVEYIQNAMVCNEVESIVAKFYSLLNDNEKILINEAEKVKRIEKEKMEANNRKEKEEKLKEELHIKEVEYKELEQKKQAEISVLKNELIKKEFDKRKEFIDYLLNSNVKKTVQFKSSRYGLSPSMFCNVEYNYYCQGNYNDFKIFIESKLIKQEKVPNDMKEFFEKEFFSENAVEIIELNFINPLFFIGTGIVKTHDNTYWGLDTIISEYLNESIVLIHKTNYTLLHFDNQINDTKKHFKHTIKWVRKNKVYENIKYRTGAIPVFLEFDYQKTDFSNLVNVWTDHINLMYKFDRENEYILSKYYEPHLFEL